jgi:SAM-dependent methyltransferase
LRQTVAPYATLAPFYDPLLGDRFFPQLRRTFEWLGRRYGLRFASAADVACGTGTFVRYLRECSVPVIYGVDRSPEMVRVAIAKNQGAGARFLLQDFATLQLPQRVDLLTCHFDSLNYLLTADDLLQALRRFRANLNPSGHIIFEMITDRPSWHGQEPRVERVTSSSVTVVRVTRRDPRRSIQTALVFISRNGRSQREIQQAIPPKNPRPIRVFSQDESRFGLLTVRRRRLTAHGVQPIGAVQHVFEWFYVYGAVEPTTGERFFLELPYLNTEGSQIFADAFAAAFPDSLNLLLLDNSGAHTAQRLLLPANVRLVFLPPYCQELNPIERVWRDLKDALAWLQFPNLDVQQDYIANLLRGYQAVTLQALTGYTYLVDAIHALDI